MGTGQPRRDWRPQQIAQRKRGNRAGTASAPPEGAAMKNQNRYLLCDQLTAKKYLPTGATNRQLAKKYAISPRTVTNWRKKGCPFAKGQWRVLDWMFMRPYLPHGAKEKFSCQFQRRFRRACVDLRDCFVLLGKPIPDHLREI
jgi:hypothetical protein